MPHCPDCGVEIDGGVASCRSCGDALDEPSTDDATVEAAASLASQTAVLSSGGPAATNGSDPPLAPTETATSGESSQRTATIKTDVEPDTDPSDVGKWHWVATGVGVVTLLGGVGAIGEVLVVGLILTGAALYLDIRRIRRSSEWDPTAWVYLGGLILLLVTLPVYLIKRARYVGL